MGYVKPALEGKSPTRKRRPPSLLINSHQTAHYDDEDIAWPPRSEEIPVHRTFIDFGSLTRTPPDSPLLAVNTAPAVMCFSVKEALDAWKNISSSDECEGKGANMVCPPSSTASSTRVSEFTTLHEGVAELPEEVPESVTSTMTASGLWMSTPCSTPRSLSEASQPTDPSVLLSADLRKEAFTGQLPATGVEAPYQGHAPPLLPFNAYYRGNFSSCRLFEVSAFSSAFSAGPPKGAQSSEKNTNATAQKQIPKESPEVAKQVEAVGNEADDESSDDDSSSDEMICPQYDENAPLPSVGSSGHSEGSCKRCCFFPKGRCNNGYDCEFCHFAHEKRKSKLKKKKKRKKKQRPAAVQDAAGPTVSKSPQSQQAHFPASPSVQQVLGNSTCWAQPPAPKSSQRTSRLIVQGLQYVPATVPTAVMPGNPATMPMLQTAHWW